MSLFQLSLQEQVPTKKKYFPWELNCREREEKKSNRLGELKDARVVCATLSLYIKRKRSFFFFRFILHHSRGSLPPFCCELSSYCLWSSLLSQRSGFLWVFFVVKIWPVWKGIENLAPIHKVVSIFDLSATARRRAITNNFYGGRRELDGASGSRQTCLSIRGVTRRRIWRFCFEEKKIGKRPARVKDRIDVIPIGEQQTRGRRVRCVTFLTLVQGKRSEWQLSPGCQDGHKLVNTCLYRLVCCISSYLTRTSIAARREYELVGDRVLGPSTVACV